MKPLGGADPLLFYGLAAGAPGAVSVVSNIAPGLCVEMREALIAFDWERALSLWRRLWPLCELLESEPYIAVTKRGCALAGTPVGSPRPPMFPLSAEAESRLATLLGDTVALAT